MSHVIGGFAQRSRKKYRLVQGRDGLWHKRYAGTKTARKRSRKIKTHMMIIRAFSPLQGALIDQMDFRSFKFCTDHKMEFDYLLWFRSHKKLASQYHLSMQGMSVYQRGRRISHGTMLDVVDNIIRNNQKRLKET